MKKTLWTILAMAAALCAQAVEIELLTNGAGSTLEGWTNSYDTYEGSMFGIDTYSGYNWFASRHGLCQLWQTVTLADHGITESDIQANPTVTASVIVLAPWGSSTCNVKVYELDANDNTLAPHEVLNRGGETISSEISAQITFSLNSSTRKLKYELNGVDSQGWTGYYGPKFRNCSLKIDRNVNVAFSSSGTALEGSWEQPPIAPRQGNYRFLGYFTAETGGDQVFNENYEYVLDAVSAGTLSNEVTLYAQWAPVTSQMEGGITRLVYRGVLSNFGEWESGLKKDMRVKVYESASAAEPLWSGDVADVPINPDGSFEAVFGNDELALAFASNNLTHVELTVGEALSPLAPRRAFASVASVNRALVAEGAASDIKVGTLGANAIVAEKITAGSLEASEMVRVEGSVSVKVKPFDIESRQETTIWRGAGVTAWGDSELIKKFDNVVAGQWLWTSDREGVVMIHATGKSRSTLRIPATIQFVRPGDEVRAPTWENGEVSVTVWGYKK